jgi:hypothetical protein
MTHNNMKTHHELCEAIDALRAEIRAINERMNQMAIDLTKLNSALSDVQAYVAANPAGGGGTSAADQAAVDAVAAQIISAVSLAPLSPPSPPAGS